MKLKEVLDKTILFFKDKGIATARFDAEMLIASALQIEKIQLYIKFDQPMTEEELEKCRSLVKRRSQGEPVAYILGFKDFYKSRFKVTPDVLIPRPETELLVEEVIKKSSLLKQDKIIIADLGSGSGCIGLSLLKEIPNSVCYFYDISVKALAVAKTNGEELGIVERCFFNETDLNQTDHIIEADIYVSNPPYIDNEDTLIEKNVKKFEPSVALFSSHSSDFELKKWSTLIEINIKKTDKPIIVGFEMGYNHSDSMYSHFKAMNCFENLNIIKDYSDYNRHIIGVHHGQDSR